MYVYDVFHLLLSLFNFQFSFRIGICEWSVWDHASPFSLPPFLPLPHPVSWRIKLMIVPVLNYSWFNKIDAYLFRFVASWNFLSLPNFFFNFSFEVCGDHPFGFVGFWHLTHPVWPGMFPGASPTPLDNLHIPHRIPISSSPIWWKHCGYTVINTQTVKTCEETDILNGFKEKKN